MGNLLICCRYANPVNPRAFYQLIFFFLCSLVSALYSSFHNLLVSWLWVEKTQKVAKVICFKVLFLKIDGGLDRAEELIWRILEHLDWSHSSKISHILALCAQPQPHLFQTFSMWIIESMKMQFLYTLWVKDCESGCVIIQLPLICNLCRCIHLYIISMSTSLEYFNVDKGFLLSE